MLNQPVTLIGPNLLWHLLASPQPGVRSSQTPVSVSSCPGWAWSWFESDSFMHAWIHVRYSSSGKYYQRKTRIYRYCFSQFLRPTTYTWLLVYTVDIWHALVESDYKYLFVTNTNNHSYFWFVLHCINNKLSRRPYVVEECPFQQSLQASLNFSNSKKHIIPYTPKIQIDTKFIPILLFTCSKTVCFGIGCA